MVLLNVAPYMAGLKKTWINGQLWISFEILSTFAAEMKRSRQGHGFTINFPHTSQSTYHA